MRRKKPVFPHKNLKTFLKGLTRTTLASSLSGATRSPAPAGTPGQGGNCPATGKRRYEFSNIGRAKVHTRWENVTCCCSKLFLVQKRRKFGDFLNQWVFLTSVYDRPLKFSSPMQYTKLLLFIAKDIRRTNHSQLSTVQHEVLPGGLL